MIDNILYTNGIKTLLDNPRKFGKLSIDSNKELNFILNCEPKVIDILKEIKNKNQINEDLHNKLGPVDSQPGVLYGLAKVHKTSAFRPILSAIGTPTYKIAKFLVPILKDLTSNEYGVEDSFDFAKEILKQNSHCFMASLDINSLFAIIRLDETTNICLNELFDKKQCVSNLDRASFEKLATKASFFVFDKTFYKQLDSVTMGSPLGPTLANSFFILS